MSAAVAPRLAVCLEYEELLESCKKSFAVWQHEVLAARRDSRSGESYGQLKALQDEYARMTAALERHEQQCATCQYIAKVGGLDFESMSRALSETH